MNIKHLSVIAAVLLAASPAFAGQVLGSADDFAVLGGSTVTNTGFSNLDGSLGLYPGTSITGLGPGADQVTFSSGTVHQTDAYAQQAPLDALRAHTALSLLTPAVNLTGQDLGNYNAANLGALAPGVYSFDSAAAITGLLQLDAQNTYGAYWVFQISSTLTTAAGNSIVSLINSAGGADVGIFWLVGTSATVGTDTTLLGNVLASTSITLGNGADILGGGAFALNGAVTMHSNTINTGFSGGLVFADDQSMTLVAIPEPASMTMLTMGLVGVCGWLRRRKRASGKV